MRVFSIIDEFIKDAEARAILVYDEARGEYAIRIDPEADQRELPFMLALFAEEGTYGLDAAWSMRWVLERVVPPERQNIGEIMRKSGLEAYDTFPFLVRFEGRCSQDEFHLVELQLPALKDARDFGELDAWIGDPGAWQCVREATRPWAGRMAVKVGVMVREARQCRGLSQNDLARMAHVQQNLISRIENGKANPTVQTLEALATAMEMDLEIRFSERVGACDCHPSDELPAGIGMLGVRRGEEGRAMTGREDRISNDLFYTCSLIDYIARKTKNRRSTVVSELGRGNISRILDLSDVYHCEDIDEVADEFIMRAGIAEGDFDNVAACRYTIPSHWDIGKVYKRLILGIAQQKGIPLIDALFAAYSSFVSDKIDDYNSAFYYDAPSNILNAFLLGRIAP